MKHGPSRTLLGVCSRTTCRTHRYMLFSSNQSFVASIQVTGVRCAVRYGVYELIEAHGFEVTRFTETRERTLSSKHILAHPTLSIYTLTSKRLKQAAECTRHRSPVLLLASKSTPRHANVDNPLSSPSRVVSARLAYTACLPATILNNEWPIFEHRLWH
jgi:hypothetical protein